MFVHYREHATRSGNDGLFEIPRVISRLQRLAVSRLLELDGKQHLEQARLRREGVRKYSPPNLGERWQV
jgi:hypothetical protein